MTWSCIAKPSAVEPSTARDREECLRGFGHPAAETTRRGGDNQSMEAARHDRFRGRGLEGVAEVQRFEPPNRLGQNLRSSSPSDVVMCRSQAVSAA